MSLSSHVEDFVSLIIGPHALLLESVDLDTIG